MFDVRMFDRLGCFYRLTFLRLPSITDYQHILSQISRPSARLAWMDAGNYFISLRGSAGLAWKDAGNYFIFPRNKGNYNCLEF